MGKSHGINVYEEAWEQLTREKAFEGYMPEKVCISLRQTKDVICRPTVLPGEYVFRGQVIGKPIMDDDACVHASISGYVEEITHKPYAPGVFEPYVKIRKEKEKTQEWRPFAMDLEKSAVSQAMQSIGLSAKRLTKSRNLIVNGFANEPYITSGYRLIMESPGKIVIGAILGAIVAEAETIYLCINEDAFDAVARMKRAVQKYEGNMGNRRPIRVLSMKRKYPGGNEKMIHKEILGKEEGTVVSVAEMAALYDGIYDGEPWTKVGITVSGEIKNPKNLWVPIGTNVKDIIDYCGGMSEGTVVIHGGPLGGQAVDPPKTWITRETGGLLVLHLPDIPVSSCIHCGMCRDVCPQGLKPDRIEKKYLSGEKIGDEERISECLQCGLCSYVCPSGRRLTEYIGQVKKGRMRNIKRESFEGIQCDYIDLPVRKRKSKHIRSMEQKSQSAPHIHRRGTIHDVMRHSIYSILPMIITYFFLNPDVRYYFLAMLLVGGGSAWLAEYFWQAALKRYVSVRDGSAVFSGLLLALLFPVNTPLWKIAVAAAAAVILAKQMFGGIGYSIIHPVIAGKLLVEPFSVPLIEPLWPLAAAALIWMIVSHMLPAAYPLVFLAMILLIMPWNLKSASIYLAAAFFIWSYETMSPVKAGRWCFPVGTALLTFLFYRMGLGVSGVFFAVACMDLIIPVLDCPSGKRI